MVCQRQRSNDRGYALMDYVLSLSLSALVFMALFAVLNAALLTSGSEQADSDLHYSARSAMQKINSDLLGAKDLQVLGGGQVMALTTGDNEPIRYYVQNGQLYRDGDAKLPVAENAASIYFRKVSAKLVEVVLLTKREGETYQLQSAFKMRTEE